MLGMSNMQVPITLIGNKFHAAWVAKRMERKRVEQMERMQSGGWVGQLHFAMSGVEIVADMLSFCRGMMRI